MFLRFGRRLALVAIGALAGCTLPGRPDPGTLVQLQQSIINGDPSTSDDDAAVLIPLLQNGQLLGACSGVIIAANLVLTARHCVSQTDEGAVCDSDGNPLAGGVVYSDRKPTDIGVITGTTLKETLDATGMQIFTTGADTLCNNDIALVLLDTALTSSPIAQLRLGSPPTDGETFRAVGWGLSNNSNGFSRRARDGVEILNVGPFDDQGGFGGVSPNEFEVGEAICSGDSGGPAFDETTKAVIGVVSRGGNGLMPSQTNPTQSCVSQPGYPALNLYTRVDGFADLFNQAFAAAGTSPWLEGGPDPRKQPAGGPCAMGGDCQSGICITKDTPAYCSQMCDGTPTSCDAPYTCQKDGDLQICELPHKHGCEMSRRGGDIPAWIALVFAIVIVRRRRARA
jgi:hypothetical protein